MSKAMILRSGTGDLRGAVGVKTAKLCAKQGQIGKRYECGSHQFSGRLLEVKGNFNPRGMMVRF